MPKLATYHPQHTPRALRIHIDEAGRGPLAGPVWVGALLALDNQFDRSMFYDSKQLPAKTREALYEQLQKFEQAGHLYFSGGRASHTQIDHEGIISALNSAVCMAVFCVLKKYFIHVWQQQLVDSTYGIDHLAVIALTKLFRKRKITPEVIEAITQIPNTQVQIEALLLDGNNTFHLDQELSCTITTIIKGDQKNPLISAASIVAKVERDRYMSSIANKFPRYHFDLHKGYGTRAHVAAIRKHGLSPLHRRSFCTAFTKHKRILRTESFSTPPFPYSPILPAISGTKPKLLLHICCAPDLSRPLHWLKKHFKLYLFRYNPNIHPRAEHSKRYEQFIKLIGLEKGDYEILEDRYDPKEFFQAMFDQRATIDSSLTDAPQRKVLQVAGQMEERSDRCNPCYSMRLEQAARMAKQHNIPYFTSTLLISPKKKMDKLFMRGVEAEHRHPSTKFLWFDFAKNDGYHHASKLTKKHGLRRQNYCGCGRTVRKASEGYSGG